MILRYLKNWIRGTKALLQLMQWRTVHRYLQAGMAPEVVDTTSVRPSQKVLVLAAHPGDDIFGCGGALVYHAEHGDQIQVIYLTDGSRSTPSGSRDRSLIEQREHEAEEGLRLAGEIETVFWQFEDGAFEVNMTTAGLLKGVLENFAPDIIYAPWYADEHPDNQQVVPLLHQVLPELKEPFLGTVWQYEIGTPSIPNRYVIITDVLEKKIRAMDAHQSLVRIKDIRDGILGLNTYRGAYARLSGPAEAFLALPTHEFMDFCQRMIKE